MKMHATERSGGGVAEPMAIGKQKARARESQRHDEYECELGEKNAMNSTDAYVNNQDT